MVKNILNLKYIKVNLLIDKRMNLLIRKTRRGRKIQESESGRGQRKDYQTFFMAQRRERYQSSFGRKKWQRSVGFGRCHGRVKYRS